MVTLAGEAIRPANLIVARHIGHLKSGFRLCRNYLHGWEGDELNILLAAAGWNLRKLMRFLWLARHWAVALVIAVRYSAGWDGGQ